MPGEVEAADAVHRAAGLAEQGDRAGARALLGEALAADPDCEPAWRWLAAVVDDDAERRFCWQKAHGIKPSADTRRALRGVRGVQAKAPAEVRWAAEPPLPPVPPLPHEGRRRRWRWVAVAAAVVVLGAAVVWLVDRAREPDPVHVALVAGLTGGEAGSEQGVLDAARMALDEANRAGGVDGRPVELLVHDDHNDPAQARQRAEEVVRDGRALAVVGHTSSDTSLAAAPVYADAGLAAVTPSATSDQVTDGHPWYFRTVFGNRVQSGFAAVYLGEVLGARRASVISEDSEYGRGIRDGFTAAFGTRGTVVREVTVDFGGDHADAAVTDAVAALRAEPDPGPVVLALRADHGARVVTALRDAGITAPLLGADAMADDDFHDAVTADGRSPGELLAIAPMASDALTGPALQWATAFRSAHGYRPTWEAATTYESVTAVVKALRDADLRLTDDSRAEDRRRVRDALAAMDDQEHAAPGLLGPVRFDAEGSAEREISVVRSDGSRFVSAPVQLVPATSATSAATGAATLAGQELTVRRIVTAGVNVNEISDLDTRDGTFFADFFLWLRYAGDDTATDVTFANAVDPGLALGTPVRTSTAGGQTYKLYRVADEFKADFDFRRFPFDRQTVALSLQNRALPETRLVYVTDPAVMAQPQEERLRGGTNATATIDHVPNWTADRVEFYRETVGSTAELGDPALTSPTGTFYSQYVTEIRVHRDLGGFLLKNLLPLALLVALTYLSLYFPTGAAAGYSIGITAILTSAVLLAAVTSPLPEVSYTVAIEWAYYAFILLATGCLLTNLLRQQLAGAGRGDVGDRVVLGARVVYPAAVVAIVLAYVLHFG
ncbi:ABC transporter substrate-binding protein [Actinosynnema sp. NPDC051121]|nr:ABC transporter substrate-binding protein [Saccharothrix sp.]